MGAYWATGAILLPYLVLAWFMGIWLHLKGSNLWILRGGLALVGLLAAGAFFWFYRKATAESEEQPEAEAGAAGADIDNLVHDAARKLRASSLGSNARLGKLPLVFLIGETGSAKTHTIVNSGLDPELLAGHVYQDNEILATATANFWYTRQAIFADIAGGVLRDGKQWSRLVQLLRPGRVSSAVQNGRQAPRAALVCFDCSRFLEERASEPISASARRMNACLQQVSQLLGISFPVYVLFTKLDRISFFPDFVRNFGKEEANSVLGTTLPVRPSHSGGVYAEEETRRLEKAFDEIFYSLSARRLELLTREHEEQKRSAAYEFPRELKKVRKLLVACLVDIARPSQLHVNPFLRGFYFSGVRPIVIDDVVAATPNEYAPPVEADAGATRIFNAGQLRIPQPVAQRVAGSRKVPQWMFLSQLFNGVLLKDQVAFRTSGVSTRVSFLRRTALITIAVVAFVCAIFFVISFVENRALEEELASATRGVPTIHLAPGQLASTTDLQPLERLRTVVARLAGYEQDGPPWHMRWGLYVGDVLYPEARRVYFQHFDEILFRQTQNNIMAALRALKDKPNPGDVFDKPYSELKAYLVTTSNPDKSTVDFLSPVLLSHWENGQQVEPERAALARKQFDFYSSELPRNNPFSSQNDTRLVAQARIYLGNFQQIERFYQALLAEADRQAPAVSFNEQFKDSVSVLTSNDRVRGAFTPAGADFMKKAILQPTRYVSGEQWVLGSAAQQLDPVGFEQRLTDRYTQDYVAQWRNVIQRAQVRGYANLPDANTKLQKLTDTTSPLLEFFWFVSQNTNVDLPQIREVFQPVATIVPPGTAEKPVYRSPGNEDYMGALTNVQVAVNTLEKSLSPTDPSAAKPLLDAAGTARQAVAKYKGKFHLDPDATAPVHESVPRLLLEPVIDAESLAAKVPGDAVNAAGKAFCQKFGSLFTKFPFNPRANEELTVTQLNDVLAPKTGGLWTFYSSTLSSLIVQQGPAYVAAPNAKVLPRFVEFFRRATALSDTLYPGGIPTPKFAYNVAPLPSNVDTILKIGSETMGQSGAAKTFYWTGLANEDVDVADKTGGSLGVGASGPWAIYHFVYDALGTWPDMEWQIQTNGRPQRLPDGRIKSFRYHFQVNGFNPLKPGELPRLQCVPQVVP